MPVVEIAPVSARASAQVRKPRRKASSTSAPRCLILSADETRRDEFVQTVTSAGWDVVRCGDVNTTLEFVERETFQLAFIDLESAGDETTSVYRECGERLATDSDGLLVVCGQGTDPSEEVWARKIGTWFYLPGVVGCEAIQMLCGEAKAVVDKRAEQKKRSASPYQMA